MNQVLRGNPLRAVAALNAAASIDDRDRYVTDSSPLKITGKGRVSSLLEESIPNEAHPRPTDTVALLNRGKPTGNLWRHTNGNQSIIEKHTTLRDEIRVAKHLCQLGDRAPQSLIRVFGVAESPADEAIILMQYCHRPRGHPALTEKTAAALLDCIVEFEDALDGVKLSKRQVRPVSRYRVMLRDWRSVDHGAEIRKELRELNESLEGKVRRLHCSGALVQSHGDVQFSNMALKKDDEGSIDRLTLFDFGRSGRWPVGYEFHHFQRNAVLEPEYDAFTDHLLSMYSRRRNVPREILVHNSLVGAFDFAMSLVNNHFKKGVIRERYLASAIRALSRL